MKYLLAICLTLLPLAANADNAPPILYSRTHILLERQAELKKIMPWQNKALAGVVLDAEVRDAKSFYRQQGWFNLSGLSDKNAVLLTFTEPTIAPIVRSDNYAPLDILLIDSEGVIRQIYPNLVLSDLAQDISPELPVMAFLLLKGGASQTLGVKPGDVVDYPLFKPPPAVLGAPAATR